MTDPRTVINRLTAIATDFDLEADRLYERARRSKDVLASAHRSDASGKRRDAAFLRDVAEGIEQQEDRMATIEIADVVRG